jgi:hypothetical protein
LNRAPVGDSSVQRFVVVPQHIEGDLPFSLFIDESLAVVTVSEHQDRGSKVLEDPGWQAGQFSPVRGSIGFDHLDVGVVQRSLEFSEVQEHGTTPHPSR